MRNIVISFFILFILLQVYPDDFITGLLNAAGEDRLVIDKSLLRERPGAIDYESLYFQLLSDYSSLLLEKTFLESQISVNRELQLKYLFRQEIFARNNLLLAHFFWYRNQDR